MHFIRKKFNSFIKNLNSPTFKQGNHPDGGAHAKFTNYSFDVDEFLRIVKIAEEHVKNHKKFNEFVDKGLLKTKDEL